MHVNRRWLIILAAVVTENYSPLFANAIVEYYLLTY